MGQDARQEAGRHGQSLTRDPDHRVTASADNEAVRAPDVDGDRPRADDARGAAAAARLRVVFCGGCNPHIDRAAVAAELAAAPAFARPGATVYLSGCPRACASDHRLTGDDPSAAVVAGAHVDGVPTAPADIAAAVRRKLKE